MRRSLEKRIDQVYGLAGKPSQKSYMEALTDALIGTQKIFTTNPKIMAFRQFITDAGMDILTFLEAASELYKELSIRGAHDLSGYIIPIPKHDDLKKIRSTLEHGGISIQSSFVSVMSLVLKPVDLPPMHSRKGEGERACLMITPIQARDWKQFEPKGDLGISPKKMFFINQHARLELVMLTWNEDESSKIEKSSNYTSDLELEETKARRRIL